MYNSTFTYIQHINQQIILITQIAIHITRALLRLERTMNLFGGRGGEGRVGERGRVGRGGRGREGGEGEGWKGQ